MANAGDTIAVAAGTYTESNITVNKSVLIQGAGTTGTIINSSATGILVNLPGQTINNLQIENVRIENGGGDAIKIEEGTTVTNMQVSDSVFHNNSGQGIHLRKGSFTNGLSIINCTFTSNNGGIIQIIAGDSGNLQNLHVNNCIFANNNFEGIFANEISDAVIENSVFEGNKRDIYINTFNSSLDVDNLIIRGNTFTNAIAQSIWFRILALNATLGAQGITIESNVFNQDVNTRTLGNNPTVLEEQGTFEAIIEAIFINQIDNQHGPLNINENTFNLSGTLTTDTSSETAFAITLNGGIKNVNIHGNIMNGNDVVSLGSAAVKISGIFFITVDDFGAMPDSANVNVSGNKITGFEASASFYDLDRPGFGFLNAGATVEFSNNFLANDMGIVSGTTGATINASGNWWGSSDEDAIDLMMSGKVDFSPYLSSGTDTDGDSANGFQGDFSLLTVTVKGEQTGNSGREAEKGGLLNNTPTFTSTPIENITSGFTYTYNITTTDADGLDTLSLTAPTLPSWLQFNNNNNGTGSLTSETDKPGVSEIGNHNVELIVTDSPKGFINKQKFTIFVTAVPDTTQSIAFVPGWNHISLTIQPQNPLIRSIFSTVITAVDKIVGEGSEFDPEANDSVNTLLTFADGKGYWVKIKASSTEFTLDIDGTIITAATTSVPLQAGWNNVGFIVQSTTNIRTALDELIDSSELIKVVGKNKNFDPNLPDSLNTLLQLNPGEGYWIKVQNSVPDFNFKE